MIKGKTVDDSESRVVIRVARKCTLVQNYISGDTIIMIMINF